MLTALYDWNSWFNENEESLKKPRLRVRQGGRWRVPDDPVVSAFKRLVHDVRDAAETAGYESGAVAYVGATQPVDPGRYLQVRTNELCEPEAVVVQMAHLPATLVLVRAGEEAAPLRVEYGDSRSTNAAFLLDFFSTPPGDRRGKFCQKTKLFVPD